MKTKHNIFAYTRVFGSFSPVHTNAFLYKNINFFLSFRLTSTLKRPKTLILTTVCFLRQHFKSPPFSPIQPSNGVFESPVFISVFGRLLLMMSENALKRYAFSSKHTSVWSCHKHAWLSGYLPSLQPYSSTLRAIWCPYHDFGLIRIYRALMAGRNLCTTTKYRSLFPWKSW